MKTSTNETSLRSPAESCVLTSCIFTAVARLQTDEDQAEWVAGPYDDDVDHDEEAAYGVEAMCRTIAALHAKATMPTALQLVPKVRTGVFSIPLFPMLAS